MKYFYKYILLISALCLFTSLTSCEINDELLERSDSSIYNKLKGDRDHSGQAVTPAGPNHIVGDARYDSRCSLTIIQECILADTYAFRLKAGGSTNSYRGYTSRGELTVKEALSFLTGNQDIDIEETDICQGGLDNAPKYLYLLPCNGDKYGDIVLLALPAKSTEGFDGTVAITKTSYVNPNNEITFSPTSYTFKYGVYTFPDESYRNDAFFALLLDTDGITMEALQEATTIQAYNPDRKRAVAVTRAIDSSGKLSNKVTRVTLY